MTKTKWFRHLETAFKAMRLGSRGRTDYFITPHRQAIHGVTQPLLIQLSKKRANQGNTSPSFLSDV